MSKTKTKIIIVGGGFGGVKTALNFANKAEFDVKLISNNTHFEYHGALYRSAVGRSPMEVVLPLREIFEGISNVEVVLDSAGFIDAKKKKLVCLDGNIYSYDKLVLALGNTVNYFNLDGMQHHSQTMHDIASTIALRHELVKLFTSESKKPIRIAIIGAGASGVELAGELSNFSKLVAKKYGVNQVNTKVMLIEGSDRILPLLSPRASEKVAKHLQENGVDIHLNIRVESCEEGNICMSAGTLGADLIVWTAGSKPVSFYEKNSDVFTLGRGGRVVVDKYLRPVGFADIFVLGDNADTKYSGMAQTALYDANFVSKNIILRSKNQSMKTYKPKKPLYVITAGPRWAVVEKGKTILSGRQGWAVRRQADLAIFKNFQPYKKAIKTWRKANSYAEF